MQTSNFQNIEYQIRENILYHFVRYSFAGNLH